MHFVDKLEKIRKHRETEGHPVQVPFCRLGSLVSDLPLWTPLSLFYFYRTEVILQVLFCSPGFSLVLRDERFCLERYILTRLLWLCAVVTVLIYVTPLVPHTLRLKCLNGPGLRGTR